MPSFDTEYGVRRRLFSDDSDDDDESVAEVSVTGDSIAQELVAEVSITGSTVEQTFVAPLFLNGCFVPGSKKIDEHRIADSVPDWVISMLIQNHDGPWNCEHCRLLGTIDGIFYSPCFLCAPWGWRHKGVPLHPDDPRTANNTYLKDIVPQVRPGDITTSN